MSENYGHITDILLEKFVLGELSPAERIRMEVRLGSDPDLAERVAQVRASNAQILRAYPSTDMASRIHSRAARAKKPTSSLVGSPAIAFGLAASLALAVITVPGVWNPDRIEYAGRSAPATNEAGIRSKGITPHLYVYRKSRDGIDELQNNARGEAGDVLQLGYIAAGKKYGVIFSVDGSANVTLHYPDDAHSQTSLDAGGEVLLPHAYRLDDAPAFEQFVFVASDSPIDTSAVLDSAQKTARSHVGSTVGRLADADSMEQTSVLIRKVEK